MFWRKKKFDPAVEAQKLRERMAGRSIDQYIHDEWIEAIKRRILTTLKSWGGSTRAYQLIIYISDYEDDELHAFCCVRYDDFREALGALIAEGLVTSTPQPDIVCETVGDYGNEITLVKQKRKRFSLFAAV